jgi:hypothetical protein
MSISYAQINNWKRLQILRIQAGCSAFNRTDQGYTRPPPMRLSGSTTVRAHSLARAAVPLDRVSSLVAGHSKFEGRIFGGSPWLEAVA